MMIWEGLKRILPLLAILLSAWLLAEVAYGVECAPIPVQGEYEALVVPLEDANEAVAVIHSGEPIYTYIAGPTSVREAGNGCYAVFYKVNPAPIVLRPDRCDPPPADARAYVWGECADECWETRLECIADGSNPSDCYDQWLACLRNCL